MRESVRAAFSGYSAKFEGVVPGLYLDVRALVTCGIGSLAEPLGLALAMPFMRADGTPASKRDIAEEWSLIKSHKELAKLGWKAAARLTRPEGGGVLHLTPEGIAEVTAKKLDENERHLRRRFPEWDDWPADAQLLVHSLAWACGSAFRFPRFEAAAKARRWAECDETGRPHHHIDEAGNPGVRPRNAAQKILGENAERVVADGLDPERLYYPATVITPGPIA